MLYIGGTTQNATEGGAYLQILSIAGSVITFAPGQKIVSETSQTVLTAPVVVTTDQSTVGANTEVSFSNPGGVGTITLTQGGSWSSLGYTVGQGIFVGSSSDANANGTTLNVNAAKPFYTITGINGATLTIQGTFAHAETNVVVDVAPVTVTEVNYNNYNNSGTITLTNGGNWTGYSIGEGIYLGSASGDNNANGTNFNASSSNPYYTITAINGQTLTVTTQGPFTAETGATVDVAPVNIDINLNTISYVLINQNKDVAVTASGTLTATAGGFIYIGSQNDLEINSVIAGTVNNPADVRIKTQGNLTSDAGAAYTIGTVVSTKVNFGNSGNAGTITLALGGSWSGYAVGDDIFVDSSTDANGNGTSLNLDSATPFYTIAAINGSTITLEAGQTLHAESGVTVGIAKITPNAVDVQGQKITLEGGQGSIGTAAAPFTVNVLGASGSLTARALNDIYLDAPFGNIPVDAIYTASGTLYLTAVGSIYDAVASDFAKIEANKIILSSGASIGDQSGNALHIDIVGTDPSDGLRAAAQSNVNIDAPDGDLNVLAVLSNSGNVTLGAGGSIFNIGNLANPTDLTSAAIAGNGANVYGNSIVLDAAQLGGGGIGGSPNAFGSAATSFNIVSAFSGAGTVSANGILENIVIDEVPSSIANTTTTGNISLLGISDFGAVAFITAAGGDILNGRSDNDAIITSGGADLSAGGNVGSGTSRAGNLTGRIVSTVGNVDAQAATGSIYLWNIGALVVGHVNGVVTPYALYAPEGVVDVQTSSPMEISQDILADGSITKQAGTVAEDDDNLTVDAGITIQSLTSSITLAAGNNIWLQGVGSNAAKLLAVTGVTLEAGDYDTSSVIGAPIDATVNFGTDANGNPTMTLSAVNTSWNSSFAIGDRILINSVPGGSTSNLTQGEDFLTITGITAGTATSGGILTFSPDATVTAAAVATQVTLANATTGGATYGTITLTNGGTWAGYSIGDGLYIQSSTDAERQWCVIQPERFVALLHHHRDQRVDGHAQSDRDRGKQRHARFGPGCSQELHDRDQRSDRCLDRAGDIDRRDREFRRCRRCRYDDARHRRRKLGSEPRRRR